MTGDEQPALLGTRPLVWAHALCSSVAHEDEGGVLDWSVLESVASVVRYDALGHGRNEGATFEARRYRWSAQVDDMLHAAGEGPFIAGGIDAGAAIALFAALRAPRRVAALVLALPPPAWELRSSVTAQLDDDALTVECVGIGSLVKDVRRRSLPPVLAEARPDANEVLARHLESMDEKLVPAILRGAAGSDLPAREEVHTLIVPTLILAWPDDPDHPLAVAEALAEQMVQADLRVATSAADVRAWPQVIAEFLADLPS